MERDSPLCLRLWTIKHWDIQRETLLLMYTLAVKMVYFVTPISLKKGYDQRRNLKSQDRNTISTNKSFWRLLTRCTDIEEPPNNRERLEFRETLHNNHILEPNVFLNVQSLWTINRRPGSLNCLIYIASLGADLSYPHPCIPLFTYFVLTYDTSALYSPAHHPMAS